MMFSLPIIATDWRGIPEIIEEGKNGFLVPVNDPDTTAEKIELLLKDSSLREIMGKKGREIFLEKFTLKKHLNKIEKVFKEIITIDE
ncbi:putative glycosyltransferase EpsD [bacterium BMS3Abin04]|nr:putative glycosyltransferase EpsD [bacterium BMS3Abin04]